MKKQVQPVKGSKPEKDLAEFEAVATRLEQRLDSLGITERDLLDAAVKVRARMLAG